ncbi:polycystic kidney disease protein 1-like 2 isoform X2 [Mercenaria mercenaria]|uniref:polycystic kidney disease protein 1-like 2 isoform X2 n=1 Tax=Mercenaria mercenaria TaxID=6596 RepID=UPI00234F9C98|nr:polycystic kidney disease protein 1-like 2 isoform X2 [Mercenaria mercenaria]
MNGLQAVIYVLNEAPYVSNETSSDSNAENTVEILKEKKRKMQIRENIVSAITKVNTSNVEVMVSVTSTLNQVTLQKEELSTEIKDQAFEMYNTFVEKFQEMEETTSDEDVTRTAATLLFGVGSVFDITTDDYSEEVDKSKESQDTYDTDSSGDKTTPSPISKEENKQRVKERTEKLLKSVGVISEIVFKRQDVDSEPALFETPVLSIAVAKVSQKNLAGKPLKAEEGDEDSTTSLALPADLDLSDTGDSVRTEFVLMKKNPYVWGENSKNIKPPVLSLELKHSHNDVLQISNLSSPMKVNLAHDGGQVAGIIRLLLTVEKSNGTVALAPSRGRPCAATFELSVEREKVTSFSLSLPGNVTALVSIGLHTKFNVTSIIGLGFRYPNDIQIIRQFYSMLSETEAETFDNASRYCELCTEFCCNSMEICTGFYEHCIYYCKHVIQNNVTENCTEIFNATVYCDSCQNLCCNGTTNCTSVLENCLFFCSLYREESLTAECRNHLYYSNLSALGTTVKQYCEECDTFCCGGTEECADMYSNCIFFCSNFMSENVTLSCGKNKKSLETIYLFPRESRKNDTSYQMYFALSVDPTDTYVLEHFSQIDPNCLGNVSVNSCTVDIDLQVPLKVSTMDCEFWDAVNETWSTSGMQISRESHGDILICTSSHLTAFSKTMLVAPTFIDPLDFELFSNFFDNPVVVTVVLVVWMLYFFLVHWARQKDKLDREKAGVIYCSDNVATRTYSYVVCITTGWWNQAGTTANVYIYLKGALYNCPRKCLKTPERKCFQTGYEDWFLITTEHGLGDIKSVSLWHDNMGSSPHWFVNQVFVKDIQMDCSWTFVYNDWLAVDRGNLLMTTTTLKPVTEEELKLKRKYNFTVTSTQDLRDGHIWMSIFSKSASNTFTRVQRLTCCLTLLLTTMLTNLMFYGIPTDDPEDQLVTGGFRLSLSQIIIGVESGLIMFPMNLLIAQLFSRVKKKPQKEEPHIPIEHFLEAIYGTTWQKVMMDINERLMLLTKTHNIEGMKYFTRVPRFPWWIVYIAWTLSITTCLTSSYFVALYGLKFGYTRSAEWLVSFFTGFFQSVFVQQPIKVFGIAFMLTLVFKKTANFDDSIPERKLDLDEEYLRSVCIKPPETHQLVMEPLPKRLLDQIKERLKIEWFMNVTIRDIILHIFYLSVILTMVHAHRNITHAFQNSETVRSLFVRPSNGFHLEKVTNAEEFYAYLHETVVPAMADITADHEYATLGSNHYLVGTYRLRQLRIKRDVCATVIPGDCKGPYSMNEEDTRDYNQSWSDIKSDDDDIVEIDHWTHRSTWDLQTLPYPGTHASYSGGGYVLELPANVALHSAIFSSVLNEGWIDDYTRAVFIEFTLYNPNVDLFTVCMYLFEFTNVGRVFPMNHEFTSSLYHYSTDYQIVVAVCEVLFVCFTILIVCIEVKKLKHVGKAEYFSDVWTFVELAQIALSIAVLGLFIKWFVTVDNVLQEFKDSQGKYFINFHSAIFWDFAFGYVSAVLITLMTLKTVKHVRYNKRIHIIFETLNIVRTVFLGYVLMFAIVTIAFAHTGFLMFGYYMGDYKTFYDSWFAIIIVLLGVGDFVGMQDSARIIGPLFIVAIIMTCQYVFLVMMTTILNVERLEAKHKLSKRKSKVTLIRYIISRVKLVLNIK